MAAGFGGVAPQAVRSRWVGGKLRVARRRGAAMQIQAARASTCTADYVPGFVVVLECIVLRCCLQPRRVRLSIVGTAAPQRLVNGPSCYFMSWRRMAEELLQTHLNGRYAEAYLLDMQFPTA